MGRKRTCQRAKEPRDALAVARQAVHALGVLEREAEAAVMASPFSLVPERHQRLFESLRLYRARKAEAERILARVLFALTPTHDRIVEATLHELRNLADEVLRPSPIETPKPAA